MRLATIQLDGKETVAIVTAAGTIPVETINKEFGQQWPTQLFDLLPLEKLKPFKEWIAGQNTERLEQLVIQDAKFGPLYRHPRKIWGIGLNYVEHAADLSEVSPNTEPASFMKPDTTIIGPGDTIQVPLQSERTTAESELGIVIGKECKDVEEENALSVIAGYTTIIDMTAEDILQKNPRYLTRAKSFDTFFSFGPQLVTADEVEDVLDLKVATVINGEIHRDNLVANMTFQPAQLISFHSKVMTLLPGDIISTGTPGAVVIRNGDVVECRIDGFETLMNPVMDLKNKG
ncbi:fumarylacetoacetate hydrolase family protein [Planomicrobium okeanokoites]|uniref:fumarylacetoacetate hydrolase family protein n=1 Tax=Planomicrobium okeanokoites TaxID=244 RepID=UPI00356AABA9